MSIDNLKLRTKILLIVVACFAGTALVFAMSLRNQYAGLLEGRQLKTQQIAEVAYSLAVRYDKEVQAGHLTKEAAQQAAIDDIRALRYGGNEYFWINDTRPFMLMHPIKPELEGKDLNGLTDSTGKAFFAEMVQAARSNEAGGFVYYLWPKAGFEQPVRKISYVKRFAPWDWVIGTGVYLDDIETAFREQAVTFSVVIAVIAIIALAFAMMVARGIMRPLAALDGIMGRLAKGDLAVPIAGTERQDEIGDMSRTVQVFKDNMTEAERMRAAQTVEQAARERRTTQIQQFTQEFNRSVAGVLEAVAGSTGQLQSTAQGMSRTATSTTELASSVAAAAEEASANVQTVASAAEELSSSIIEISRQVTQSSSIANTAVGEASRVDALVQSLVEAAQRIGEVVNLINDIASQTNLLALNATMSCSIKQRQFA